MSIENSLLCQSDKSFDEAQGCLKASCEGCDEQETCEYYLTEMVKEGGANGAMKYTFRGFYIPDHMMDALQRYIEHGIEPGDFLTAVLCNNLSEAIGRADDENMANLPAYIGYLYNGAPNMCWGSKERMAQWMEMKQEARNNKPKEPTSDFATGAMKGE